MGCSCYFVGALMDFAKRQLEKFGWQEGKGLGKDSTGILEPLKAVQKRDVKGLGVVKAAYFPWWDELYNKTANEIIIEKSETPTENSTEKPRKSKVKKESRHIKEKVKKKRKSKKRNALNKED